MRYSALHIRNLRENGMTWRQIMEELGCCRNTIRRALVDDIDDFLEKENRRQRKWRERKQLEQHSEQRLSRIASMRW